MLGQSHEMLVHQRTSPRWKEWIPLASQQLRLRNLIQVIAYNVNANDKIKCDSKTKSQKMKLSFYYTLHLTSMSAPFYTSEKLESENPKWAEIEIGDLVTTVNASVNGIVLRLWVHRNAEQDQVLTIWGVYFSGLVYLGPKLSSEPSAFGVNTVVFHMQGGYFTAPQCCKESVLRLRHSQVKISAADIRPSYTVSLVSRLLTIQQAIKKQRSAAQVLRERISVGGYSASEPIESATLRRLLNKNRPQAPQRQEILKLQREIEMIKFRVEMLSQERARKNAELQNLKKSKSALYEINQDRGSELMNNYQTLHKEIEFLKEKRKTYIDIRDDFLMTNTRLIYRQKQLISKLCQIYPISQLSDGKFEICGVNLPNSEDFAGHDEIMISVSLGYVAHVLQMISMFLQVPLRYPIVHFGSWSKIIDHIVEKIPEKDREFPLFSRGKDKLQFNYGVYLLNKNVSQLRWYCGLPTQDLRATLPNLSGLMNIPPTNVPEFHFHHYHHHISPGSSLELRSSSQNQSPVGSLPKEPIKQHMDTDHSKIFEKCHRASHSMDGLGINFQPKQKDAVEETQRYFKTSNENVNQVNGSSCVSNSLSYSLDKGLDEYKELKKAEVPLKPPTSVNLHNSQGWALLSVGSEPILTEELRHKIAKASELEVGGCKADAKKDFLQSWEAKGPAPVCSDDEVALPSQMPPNGHSDSSTELVKDNVPDVVNEVAISGSHNLALQNEDNVHAAPVQSETCSDNSDTVIEKDATNGGSTSCISDISLSPQKSQSPSSNELTSDDTTVENGSVRDEVRQEIAKDKSKSDDASCNNDCDLTIQQESLEQYQHSLSPPRKELENGTKQIIGSEATHQKDDLDEVVSLEEMNNLIDNSILVDSVFASVASRTEALANRSGTFNLVRSRHSSMLEDSNS